MGGIIILTLLQALNQESIISKVVSIDVLNYFNNKQNKKVRIIML